MWSFQALCDEFSVNTRLFLKLDLAPSRETTLHFFERIRRAFPTLTRLRRRDDGGLTLDDEDADGRGRRFLRLDSGAIRMGVSCPRDGDAVVGFGELVLAQAPAHLSLSELDYDYMDVVFNFDLEYRGNHDELIAEVLFAGHPLIRALTSDGERMIDCQPFFGVTMSATCDTQVYVEVRGRTSTYEIRHEEYEPNALSVQVTARRYWGVGGLPPALEVFRELVALAERYAEERVLPSVIKPLAAAIASRR